jgi:hypothetical protein
VAAAFVGSVIADLVTLAVGVLVLDATLAALPADLVLAAATLNAALAAVALFPARTIARRIVVEEPSW